MGHAGGKSQGSGRRLKGQENGGHTWHIGEELILMSKHRARPNDCSSGECLADRTLTGSFRTIELGGRGWRSVEVRYVNQPRDANARGNLGNAPSTFDVHVVIREISLGRKSWLALHSHEILGRSGPTLSHNHDQRDCTRYPSAGRIPQSVPRCECPIPTRSKRYVAGAIVNIYKTKHRIGERTIDTI